MKKATRKATPTIRELASKADWDALYPLIAQLNKGLTQAGYRQRLKTMLEKGYRCVAAFEGKDMIGACGFWIGVRFWNGKNVDLDNLVVKEGLRSKGIGSKLVAHVEAVAKAENCTMAVLDSYTTAQKAHRFYFREGYSILGYHFTKDL